MLGVLVNTLTVIAGSILGLVFKGGIPKELSDFIMKGVALCVLYIGIDGALNGENALITIISIVTGAVIGYLCDLDGKLNRLADSIERKFKMKAPEDAADADGVEQITGNEPVPHGMENRTKERRKFLEKVSDGRIAEGFVTASLLFCVGAMTIVGSLEAGLSGDNAMLFTKATLDGCSSVILAATLGLGVLCSAAFVFAFQGAIVLLAGLVAPVLSESCIAEMTCVGSLLIIAMGLNMLGITRIKVMDYMPAVFIPIILCLFM